MPEPSWRILQGDALEQLRELPAAGVQTCVTSPPYFGLRDYGHPGQLGLESTPDEYVARLVEVFREVRRVLRDDGTLWLNLGDSYCTKQRGSDNGWDKSRLTNPGTVQKMQRASLRPRPTPVGAKHKDLWGIPWMVAFALRADGWFLRSDIVWAKPNPTPESVRDRPTKAHEYVFLLSKSARYFYDAAASREENTPGTVKRFGTRPRRSGSPKLADVPHADRPVADNSGLVDAGVEPLAGHNKRSVWIVPTQPFPGAHFAVFPPKLIEPCILAGSTEGDTVLDPFAGVGTTGLVAIRHGRSFIGVELNPDYAEMGRQRIRDDAPLWNPLNEVADR